LSNYIILALCLVVLIAYLFDLTSKYSRIPSLILLIAFGAGIRYVMDRYALAIPYVEQILPVTGTLALILIVMEASLELKLDKNKKWLITKSVLSAILLFAIFTTVFAIFISGFLDIKPTDAFLNAIPVGMISSAVAVASGRHLGSESREFVVYESAVSDVTGILVFAFILRNDASIGKGLGFFFFSCILIILVAAVVTFLLATLLHKTRYHVNYVIIMTSVVLVYILAELLHLPALFFVLVFGLSLSNNKLIEKTNFRRYVDFGKFRNDVESFRKIVGELTFLVRSFFFIIFGYYIKVGGLFTPHNLIGAISITAGIFILRLAFLKFALKITDIQLILFAPRGLITILLFLSIPAASRNDFINEELITLVILLTIALMTLGNFLARKGPVYSRFGKTDKSPAETPEDLYDMNNPS
jgi:potassium/hydrogen antiporter